MATTEEEQEEAIEARKDYESEIDEKYGDDEALMEEIEEAAEACENKGN